MDAAEAPRRGRPPRAAQETQRRRRRGNEDLSASAKLAIPPEAQEYLDRNNLVPRWANDEGTRLHRLTVKDDYDKVPEDLAPPVLVGVAQDGKTPVHAHLLAKPRDFVEEDQREREERRRAQERAFVTDPSSIPQAAGAPNPGQAVRYVAKGSKIESGERRGGNQILE